MNQEYLKIKDSFEKLKKELESPEVFRNQKKAAELSKKYGEIKNAAEKILELENLEKNLGEAESIIASEQGELNILAQEEISSLSLLKAKLEQEIEKLLSIKSSDGKKNVIMEIRAGTGGDEASLFSADLFSMYSRFAEKNNWKTSLLSSSRSPSSGFKEIIFEISGTDAYEKLKNESGVHRVQRIPTTEKAGRVHTSTATVAVLPTAEKIDINIKPEDLRIDVFRAGGPGGQNVNKVETAVRITHLPTNFVVSCQDEKSQSRNKEKAMKILCSRLLAFMEEKEAEKRRSERKGQIGTALRAEKIRTYNFPQDRLTDHRLKKNWHNLEGIMAGNLEPIIDSFKNKP